MKAFDVYINGTWVNRVFDSESDPQEVKRSLVNHDGYYADITVLRGGERIPSGKCWTEKQIQRGSR